MESTCPKDVLSLIEKANGEKLEVYINSGGGSVFAGSEIYSALRDYEGQVEIHVVGIAASAASVIACASSSDISPTATLMVHNPALRADGDFHDMDKTSKILQEVGKTIAAAYVAKTGMSEAEALKLMDNETWLTAEKAVEIGLIDAISKPKNLQMVAAQDNVMLPLAVVEKIRNTVKPPLNEADIFM
ncbi:MAG: Clp protease ClpP, partial [Oscillospiraceae bacterium]